MAAHRRQVIDELVPYFDADDRYILLVGDMGFGAIDHLREAHPARIINCGVMEAGATGIAAGLALSGCIPIFYTIVNFLVFRSLEQVRNDVLLQGLNVKLIGTGANDYFRFLGPSHCCGEQDVELMRLIGMPVFDPYTDDRPFNDLVRDWLTSDRAGYLRV